jgi:hypothetical protein
MTPSGVPSRSSGVASIVRTSAPVCLLRDTVPANSASATRMSSTWIVRRSHTTGSPIATGRRSDPRRGHRAQTLETSNPRIRRPTHTVGVLAADAAECSRAHGILTAGRGAALSSHQRDSDPCFSLERVGTRFAATRTYGAVAISGCQGMLKWVRLMPHQPPCSDARSSRSSRRRTAMTIATAKLNRGQAGRRAFVRPDRSVLLRERASHPSRTVLANVVCPTPRFAARERRAWRSSL